MANKKSITISEVPPNEIDHAHRAHAVLSASAAKHWLNCPPSARLNEQFPNTSSEFAEEGTAVHELCEYKVRKYLHDRMERPQSDYYNDEIERATDVYAEFVIGIIEEMKCNGSEPLALVEEKLDYSHIAPSGFGTGDMIVIGKDKNGCGLLHIVDYKNGKGVFVDADHNPQMMLYALGALRAYDYIYDVGIVRMSIVQPRLENISTCEMTVRELKAWAESIKPIALLAYEGKGEQKTGDWCRFCKAKPVCQACKDEALALCREDFLDLDAGALSDSNTEESYMTAISSIATERMMCMNQNEMTYLITMKLFRKMLEQGLITAEKYAVIDTKMRLKYAPKIGTLFCENPHKTVDFSPNRR